MSYISKAERERARWMTLAEAVDWICQCGDCDRRFALRRLRDALGDRELHIKWEDQKPIRSDPETLSILSPDWPPDDTSFWQQARIRRGRVFDPLAKQWRTLLILKHSIFRFWPEPPDLASVASAASESGQAAENGSNVVPITKAKGGAPSDKEKIYQALDKLSHERGHSVKDTMPRERLAELVAKECDKLLGKSRGWALGTVLNHIRSWPKKD